MKHKPTPLPQFPSHPNCVRCEYHKECTHVGLSTLWESCSLPPGNHPAIVCIGGSPGHQEDRYGEVWAGPAGRLLKEVYLAALNRYSSITIYYTNVVRCHGGLGDPKPPKSVTSACIPYLHDDLRKIEKIHSLVLLFVLGSPACQAMFEKTLGKAARSFNGRQVEIDLCPTPE